ncbi:hypothetical protein [Cysteiniphilum marinum]|uniref:hypothetical protein n=1 Tax=Cysteiniphilum marinum TaxID=2774191 RepID=UPI00193B7C5C|nr:hypothetical protein [Cysteiniphilum marinum]
MRASAEMITDYNGMRKIGKERIYQQAITFILKEDMLRCAKRLSLLQGDSSLLINTEHEMNVLVDHCLYNYNRDGYSAIQRAYKKLRHEYSESDCAKFKKFSEASFKFVRAVNVEGDDTVLVRDILTSKEYLLIDYGFNKTIKENGLAYGMIANFIDCDDYIMSTGASIPVSLNSQSKEAQQLQEISSNYIDKKQQGIATDIDYKQMITDLYKLCFHEEMIMLVPSATVPFGKEALKKKVEETE